MFIYILITLHIIQVKQFKCVDHLFWIFYIKRIEYKFVNLELIFVLVETRLLFSFETVLDYFGYSYER